MMKRIVFILIICFWVGRVLAIDHRIPAVQDSVRLDTVKKSLQAQSLQHLLERDSLPLMTLPVDAQMKMSPVYLPDSLIRITIRIKLTKLKKLPLTPNCLRQSPSWISECHAYAEQ